MPVHFPEFGDFCDVAADVLGTTSQQIARFPNVGLAESALAAPRAGFGDVEFYPTPDMTIVCERAAKTGEEVRYLKGTVMGPGRRR